MADLAEKWRKHFSFLEKGFFLDDNSYRLADKIISESNPESLYTFLKNHQYSALGTQVRKLTEDLLTKLFYADELLHPLVPIAWDSFSLGSIIHEYSVVKVFPYGVIGVMNKIRRQANAMTHDVDRSFSQKDVQKLMTSFYDLVVFFANAYEHLDLPYVGELQSNKKVKSFPDRIARHILPPDQWYENRVVFDDLKQEPAKTKKKPKLKVKGVKKAPKTKKVVKVESKAPAKQEKSKAVVIIEFILILAIIALMIWFFK